MLFDPRARLDEIPRVVVVLFDAGRNREDVRVEDDVFRRKANLFDKNVVGTFANVDLPLERIRLTLLIERHDNYSGAVQPTTTRLLDEFRFAFLQADRIDDGLTLNAPQARFDDVPFARVDHHRYARDVRFGRDQVQEPRHQSGAVEHPFVHVDVDDLRAVVDLVPCDVERSLERPFANQFLEPRGAGDVRALADVHKQRRLVHFQRLESRQTQLPR